MNLFNYKDDKKNEPLASRMRPTTISQFFGQEHIVGEGRLIRRCLKTGNIGSCIFWGPPGCGKTTLFNIIANTIDGQFERLNAVSSGVADIKKVVENARSLLEMYGKKTYLLLDECHRFSKTQSDSLLPAIESGTVIFIGSTTENPYAAMTPAIVSRCTLFEFKRLNSDDIKKALLKALQDKEKGLGLYNIKLTDDALEHFVYASAGDLRIGLNGLELAALTTEPVNGLITIDLNVAENSIQKRAISVDENLFYNLLSAFCKSLRGSDADAAVYYAMRLIEAGCDPMVVARRLVVHSSEDVGMADPQALVIATSAMYALEKIGLPEAKIPLCNAIIYVCCAEKSNTVVIAREAAEYDARNNADDDIPPYLKDTNYGSLSDKKAGQEYKYPHDFGGYIDQQYLPDSLKDRVYYKPTKNGYEKNIVIKKLKDK